MILRLTIAYGATTAYVFVDGGMLLYDGTNYVPALDARFLELSSVIAQGLSPPQEPNDTPERSLKTWKNRRLYEILSSDIQLTTVPLDSVAAVSDPSGGVCVCTVTCAGTQVLAALNATAPTISTTTQAWSSTGIDGPYRAGNRGSLLYSIGQPDAFVPDTLFISPIGVQYGTDLGLLQWETVWVPSGANIVDRPATTRIQTVADLRLKVVPATSFGVYVPGVLTVTLLMKGIQVGPRLQLFTTLPVGDSLVYGTFSPEILD